MLFPFAGIIENLYLSIIIIDFQVISSTEYFVMLVFILTTANIVKLTSLLIYEAMK